MCFQHDTRLLTHNINGTYQSVFSRDFSVPFTHQFITTRMRETRLKNLLIWPAERKCNEGNVTEPSI